MSAIPSISRVRKALLVLPFACLLPAGEVAAREQATPAPTDLITNTIVVTNVVLVTVTNYVVTTNVVITPNAAPAPARKSWKLPWWKKLQTRKLATLPDLSWVPPLDGFDWIQLKSGEWLKGELRAMQDRKLDFTSKELKDQTFDWKDIRQVRSPRTMDALFLKGDKVSGTVTITPEQVTVGGAVPESRPRDTLQSLTPGWAKERNYWSGKGSAGLTLRSGNTESIDYNAQAHLQRRTPATRLSLDYIVLLRQAWMTRGLGRA
jgi:hypothetical protein